MADKERILVVDDEPSIRKYLQTLLEVDGFAVEAVPSGKDAVRSPRSTKKAGLPSPVRPKRAPLTWNTLCPNRK